MIRSKSSRRWLDRHLNDEYVKRAQQEGYRSRAAYKLLEIQQRDRLLRPGMRVVDLGAAPGGWSQVAKQLVGPEGRVIAVDVLDMEPLPGVTFIKGDFRDQGALEAIRAAIGAERVDVVISDMAPNVTGMKAVDQPRAMYLAELVLHLAEEVLNSEGCMLVKVFQGEGFDEYLRETRRVFRRVVSRKPKASRPRSREMYLVARSNDV